jgi:hypothetical protein
MIGSIVDVERPIVSSILRSPILGSSFTPPTDAIFYADFLNDQYFWNGAVRSLTDLELTRATEGFNYGSDGQTIQSFGTGQFVRAYNSGVYDGISFAPLRTNVFLNSETPVDQTVTLTTGRWCLAFVGDPSAEIEIVAGTGIATGLVTATTGYAVGECVQFTVTTAGTFNIVISGDVYQVDVQRENTASAIDCFIPRPIRTFGSPVTVNADTARVVGLTGWDVNRLSYVAVFRQLGRANFPRLVSGSLSGVESSLTALQFSSDFGAYFVPYSSFPATTYGAVSRRGVSAAVTGNRQLIANGSVVHTAPSWAGPTTAVNNFGIGSTGNAGSATAPINFHKLIIFNRDLTSANLIANGA